MHRVTLLAFFLYSAASAESIDLNYLKLLEWRSVGPSRGGRVEAVAGDPIHKLVFYFGSTGGGVWKTEDAGITWRNISDPYFKTASVGAIAVAPSDPNIVYAGMGEACFRGDVSHGDGVYKSTDAGKTWPSPDRGIYRTRDGGKTCGIAQSPAKPDRVWAIVDAETGKKGVFRIDDAGTVYVLNIGMWKSTDGGKTYRPVRTPHGYNHDLWIDPADPQRLIEGNDGGATVSFTGATSWSSILNQPTAQMYHVVTDNQFPYRLYAAQQDNSSISLPSRSDFGAITPQEWFSPANSESGYIAVNTKAPNIAYMGDHHYLYRYDNGNHQTRDISPNPETHYGWDVISPDLTRHDPSKLEPTPSYGNEKMGEYWGPITRDNTGVEWYSTVFAFAESPAKKDLAYIAATRYKLQDSRPYLFKTSDYGNTWTPITNGIPDGDFTHVIREDPGRRGLLYAGTETGVYVSFDDGANWQSLRLNLPVTPVHDLIVHGSSDGLTHDLIAATHGRGFWILDEVSLFQQFDAERLNAAAALFKPAPAVRYRSYLKNESAGPVTITISDSQGKPIKTFSSADVSQQPSGGRRAAVASRVTVDAGANRFIWNMEYPAARVIPGTTLHGPPFAPLAASGTYTVSLQVDGRTYRQPRTRANQDLTNYPSGIDNKLIKLAELASMADAPPTKQAYDRFHALSEAVAEKRAQVETIIKTWQGGTGLQPAR
jgi:photosystem II stability/assembly factor-like uncharacterized protein